MIDWYFTARQQTKGQFVPTGGEPSLVAEDGCELKFRPLVRPCMHEHTQPRELPPLPTEQARQTVARASASLQFGKPYNL